MRGGKLKVRKFLRITTLNRPIIEFLELGFFAKSVVVRVLKTVLRKFVRKARARKSQTTEPPFSGIQSLSFAIIS